MHTALFNLFVSATVVNLNLGMTNQLDDKCSQTKRLWACPWVGKLWISNGSSSNVMVTYPADKSREAMPTLSPRACGESKR